MRLVNDCGRCRFMTNDRGRIRMMLVSVPRAAARIPRPRAGNRDDAGDDRAKQRQKDNGLIHRRR